MVLEGRKEMDRLRPTRVAQGMQKGERGREGEGRRGEGRGGEGRGGEERGGEEKERDADFFFSIAGSRVPEKQIESCESG